MISLKLDSYYALFVHVNVQLNIIISYESDTYTNRLDTVYKYTVKFQKNNKLTWTNIVYLKYL